MVEKYTVEALSDIEKKALSALNAEALQTFEEISEKSGLQIDSVRRAIAWLEEKNLVEVQLEKSKKNVLSEKGKEYLEKGLPEERFLKAMEGIGGPVDFEELKAKASLKKDEFNFALGQNKKKNFVVILKGEKPRIQLTEVAKEVGRERGKELLEKIEQGAEIGEEKLAGLVERGLAEEIEKTRRKAKLNFEGEEAVKMLGGVKERAYNIQGKVPEIFIGKKQPYIQYLLKARRRLTELGFVEMDSPIIVQEFYNFDALFQPQNHPARQWTDTYQLKQPKLGKLPNQKIVANVKAAHENGGKQGARAGVIIGARRLQKD